MGREARITTIPPRPLLLVVDGDGDVRSLLREAARARGFDVAEAASCPEGIEAARLHRPDLVLLGVEDCGDGGLAPLREIHDEDPSAAVVLMVGGLDDAALERALGEGAVNALRKPLDRKELDFLLREMYAAIEEEADIRQVLHLVASRRTRLRFPGTPEHIGRIVAFLGREARNHFPGLRVPVTEIKLALYEALANAIEHGNLEIDFDTKTRALGGEGGGFEPLLRSRLQDPRLGKRRIWVEAEYLADRVVYRVRDEGVGFEPGLAIERLGLTDTNALHGRGIALIHHYMDRVWWNPRGNEIRMMRRIVEGRRRRRARSSSQAGGAPRRPRRDDGSAPGPSSGG